MNFLNSEDELPLITESKYSEQISAAVKEEEPVELSISEIPSIKNNSNTTKREDVGPLTTLDIQLNELLSGCSADCIKNYKNMEIAIRSAYENIKALNLDEVLPSINENSSLKSSVQIQPKDKEPQKTITKGKYKLRTPVSLTKTLFKFTRHGAGETSYKTYPLESLDDTSVKRLIKDPVNDIFTTMNHSLELDSSKAKPVWRQNTVQKLPPVPNDSILSEPAKTKKKKTKKSNKSKNRLVGSADAAENNLTERRPPLEWFDVTPQTSETSVTFLLRQAHALNERGIIAYSKYHTNREGSLNEIKWEKCTVLEFSVPREQYLIEWFANKSRKWVRRLNILLPGEKLGDLSIRIENAAKERARYEEEVRNYKQIHKISNECIYPYPSKFKYEILKRVGRPIKYHERKIIVCQN